MRILITGSNGFVAQKFCEQLFDHHPTIEVLGISKSTNRNPYLQENQFRQIDLEDFEALKQELLIFKPSHILHTAAITAVEACETNISQTRVMNVELCEFINQYAIDNHCHVTFLSTDFVFDGNDGPYDELHETNPLNAYGKSKETAENIFLETQSNTAIIRTILVYGVIPDKERSNLVLWAKKQLESNNRIKVVNDQWRMPTWVDDLSTACLSAMQKQAKGIFHISGNEMMTILEAVELVADYWKLDKTLIDPISAEEIGQKLNRPRKTGFILEKAKQELNFTPTAFVVSLQKIDQQFQRYN